MNPLNNIWNYNYIQQQTQQQYHQSQIHQILEATHKLQDFLDSIDKVDPYYQTELTANCCAVLFDYLKKHNNI